MYGIREALAFQGQLPAQHQQGVTPQLLDLLAMQKVEADKKAAATQLALNSGQTPPTVAQSMEQKAMQGARQEIAQKMGLQGLIQQQTQGAPQMPAGAPQPPQQGAPQAMAAGGLTSLPSNLPRQYAGGGIVAFEDGGSTDEAAKYKPEKGDTLSETEYKKAMRAKLAMEAGDAQRKGTDARFQATQGRIAGGLGSALGALKNYFGSTPENNNYSNEGRGVPAPAPAPATTAPQAAATSQMAAPNAVAEQPTGNVALSAVDQGRVDILESELNKELAYKPTDAADAHRKEQNLLSLQSEISRIKKIPVAHMAQRPTPGGLPALASQGAVGVESAGPTPTPGTTPFMPMQAEATSGLQRTVEKSIGDTLGRTQADILGQNDALHDKYITPSQKKLQEVRESGLAELQKLQEQAKAGRPSGLLRALQLMGRNVHSRTPGIGGAFEGVSEGMDATQSGYNAQDMDALKTRQALLAEMAAAQAQNDIGRYKEAVAVLKENDLNVRAAQGAGAGMVNTQENAKQRISTAQTAADARRDAAAMAAQARADAKADGLDMRQQKLLADMSEKAASMAQKSMADPMFVAQNPKATLESEFAKHYELMRSKLAGYVPPATSAASEWPVRVKGG